MSVGRKGRLASAIAYILIIGAAGAFIWYWYSYRTRPVETNAPPVPAVRVATPTVGTIARTLRVGGVVQSGHMVVILPRVGGQRTGVFADVGAGVTEGETVARIDPTQYQLSLEQAQVAYNSALTTFDRVEKLYKAGSTTEQSYDQAKAARDGAKSQLDLAELQLGYTSIASPITGVVLRRNAESGNNVGPQSPVLTVATLENLEVNAPIPETHYREFASGAVSGVDVTVPALSGQSVNTSIDAVSPMVSPDTKNFDVRVKLSGPGSYPRPGMYVDVTFTLERHDNVATLPLSALVAGSTLWYVDSGGTARSVELSGYFSNGALFEVPDAYRTARVIVQGQHFLKNGQHVNVLTDAATRG